MEKKNRMTQKKWTCSKKFRHKDERIQVSNLLIRISGEKRTMKTLEELMQLMKDTNTQIQNAQ